MLPHQHHHVSESVKESQLSKTRACPTTHLSDAAAAIVAVLGRWRQSSGLSARLQGHRGTRGRQCHHFLHLRVPLKAATGAVPLHQLTTLNRNIICRLNICILFIFYDRLWLCFLAFSPPLHLPSWCSCQVFVLFGCIPTPASCSKG